MDQHADVPEVRAGAHYVLIGGFAVADRQTLIRTKRTIRPSDAADRVWLVALGEE